MWLALMIMLLAQLLIAATMLAGLIFALLPVPSTTRLIRFASTVMEDLSPLTALATSARICVAVCWITEYIALFAALTLVVMLLAVCSMLLYSPACTLATSVRMFMAVCSITV